MTTPKATTPSKAEAAAGKAKAKPHAPKPTGTPVEAIPSEWVLDTCTSVPIERLDFDLTASMGQIRKVDPKWLLEVKKSLTKQAPTLPIQAILVATDHTSMPLPQLRKLSPLLLPDTRFIVISGQHRSIAARDIGEELGAQGKVKPDWCKAVQATTLRHDTPLEVRMMAAGRSQAGQQQVERLKLGRAVAFIHQLMEQNPHGDEQDLAWRGAMMGAQKDPDTKV